MQQLPSPMPSPSSSRLPPYLSKRYCHISNSPQLANTLLQIVAKGKGANSRTAFYKRNNRWTEGLISAAKAVASSTNMLIETADGVISGRNKLEQMYIHTLCLDNVPGGLIFLGPGLWLPMT